MQPATEKTVSPARSSVAGKTVIIVDDDAIIRDYLSMQCRHLGLKVETASDGLHALIKIGKTRPDLLILDLHLPDVEGFRVVERLSDPKFLPVPVIMLTASSDDASKQRCKDLNCTYVHKNTETWANLELLIHELLGRTPATVSTDEQPQTATPRVLVVDDDSVVRAALSQTLQKYQLNVLQASGGTEGFLVALRNKPDLVVTDYNMESGSGHYLLSRIKGSPSTKHIPVIVYTATPMTQGEQYAIERDLRGRGQAAAFLIKRPDQSNLIAEVRKHVAIPA